jgi:hypothetical protein
VSSSGLCRLLKLDMVVVCVWLLMASVVDATESVSRCPRKAVRAADYTKAVGRSVLEGYRAEPAMVKRRVLV